MALSNIGAVAHNKRIEFSLAILLIGKYDNSLKVKVLYFGILLF